MIKIIIITHILFFSLQLQAQNIVFKNFDKQIELVKTKDSYLIKNTKTQIQINNKLIVVTNKKYNKKKLIKAHKNITQVQQLYIGKDRDYYLVSLKQDTDLQRTLQKLIKKRGIMSVQPDILQTKEKSHDDHAHVLKPRSFERVLPNYLKILEIKDLWKNTKGKGAKIAIIDDGFDLTHEDLKHLKQSFTYDADNQHLSAAPLMAIDTHGTKIAGVIFAAHNAIGIDGIAPQAQLIAIRQPNTWTSKTLIAFQVAKLAGADIINCSWNTPMLMQVVADVVSDLATNGRDGKGIAVVFAAGNDQHEILANSTEASIDAAIVVGAIGFNPKRQMPFTNFGKSVDLSAFGNTIKTTLPDNKYGTFRGTSLSAAIISGLSALLISQNPQITLKELQSELKKLIQFDLRQRIQLLRKNNKNKMK